MGLVNYDDVADELGFDIDAPRVHPRCERTTAAC